MGPTKSSVSSQYRLRRLSVISFSREMSRQICPRRATQSHSKLVAQREFESLWSRFDGILSSNPQPSVKDSKPPKTDSESPKLQNNITVRHPEFPDILVSVKIDGQASVVEMLAKVQEAKEGIVSNSEMMTEAVAEVEAKARVQLAETEEAFSLAKKKWERGLEKSKKEANGIQLLMTMLLIHQLYPGLPIAAREPSASGAFAIWLFVSFLSSM